MKTVEKQMQTLRFDIKSFDDSDRSFIAVASDNTVDRHGEVIDQEGWDLTNFKNNPVVPWGHDYYNPPVARAEEIGFVDGKLMFRPKFATADEYPFADTIYKLYKGGYLRAFSVGFIPQEMEGNTFTKAELLEISAVTVPSNPNALALAYKEGVIDDTERKALIGAMNAQIKSLTELERHKHNQDKEIDMEEIKTLLTESLATLKTEVVEEVKAYIDEKVKNADEVVDGEGDEAEVKDEEVDGEGSADSSDESSDEGAGDGDETVSEEEAQAIIQETVNAALAKAQGKVE